MKKNCFWGSLYYFTCQSCGDFSFFPSRHILAATHFNFNLDREEECRESDGVAKVKVTWPKFLNGEAKIREVRIKQNYGRKKCESGLIKQYCTQWQTNIGGGQDRSLLSLIVFKESFEKYC